MADTLARSKTRWVVSFYIYKRSGARDIPYYTPNWQRLWLENGTII